MITATKEVQDFLDEDYSLQRERACISQAKREQLEIVKGDEHTLVFDLDSDHALQVFMDRVEFLRAKFGMTNLEVTRSKTQGHYHAVAILDPAHPPISDVLRLAIQACLGSDWKKEMLGVLRTLNYSVGDSLLFRPSKLTIVYSWSIQEDQP